ncbi:MAG: phosphoribosylglycinamide formyltransferase [Prevotellaceae bacterium]|jgi:phosphoribosylglycinamide formyltransferase-1|nr:phosphoribosylglycinamide formyltransferase [Prevotellaceae bacterium]
MLKINMLKIKNIAIFASGSGSNAENIIRYFENNENVKVKILLCNIPTACVLKRADNFGVPSVIFSKDDFYKSDKIIDKLLRNEIDLIVLAGFLWLVPESIIHLYNNRIVNIHPALLPDYGGKGMYGNNVHKAVIADGKKESGITIHYVNENYDDGDIIFQAKCAISDTDTPETLAQKVHALEYEYYPKIIESVLMR